MRTALIVIALLTIPLAASSGLAASVESCIAGALPPAQIVCLTQAAIDAGDPELCLRSAEASVRWRCVAGYADQAGDVSQCAVLPANDMEPAGISRELCVTHLALVWRKAALCETLTTPNLDGSCLMQLVHLGGDKALCARIEQPIIKDACLAAE